MNYRSLLPFQLLLFFFPPEIADLANQYKGLLSSDSNAQYDQLIEINLSEVGILLLTISTVSYVIGL